MYNRILVPLDGSELAEQVLPSVIELANGTGAEIILLRIPDFPVYEYILPTPDVSITLQEQAHDQAQQYLERIGRDLRAVGLHVQSRVVYSGAAYSTILETAKALDADLIAMSTHGRSGLARLVMGSVADDVVRHAELPVLLVRPHPAHSGLPVHFENGYSPLALN